jgi:hypothetical protein
VKFGWIAAEKASFKISELCRALDVSSSGYAADSPGSRRGPRRTREPEARYPVDAGVGQSVRQDPWDMAWTRMGRLIAGFVLGGCVLMLGGAIYLVVLIFDLNPRLVGADALAVKVLGAIGLLAAGGIVITIRHLR